MTARQAKRSAWHHRRTRSSQGCKRYEREKASRFCSDLPVAYHQLVAPRSDLGRQAAPARVGSVPA